MPTYEQMQSHRLHLTPLDTWEVIYLAGIGCFNWFVPIPQRWLTASLLDGLAADIQMAITTSLWQRQYITAPTDTIRLTRRGRAFVADQLAPFPVREAAQRCVELWLLEVLSDNIQRDACGDLATLIMHTRNIAMHAIVQQSPWAVQLWSYIGIYSMAADPELAATAVQRAIDLDETTWGLALTWQIDNLLVRGVLLLHWPLERTRASFMFNHALNLTRRAFGNDHPYTHRMEQCIRELYAEATYTDPKLALWPPI